MVLFFMSKFKEDEKMKYGYARVSTKGQLDGNSIEEQTNKIKANYLDVEIVVESFSGAKERPLFNQMLESAKVSIPF